MNRIIFLWAVFFAVILSFSCTKEKTNDGFSNQITFGTSVNYTDLTLVGEGTSFSAIPGNITFRLESEEDFNSNSVKFVILKDGTAYSTEIRSTNPVPTGHIYITSFNFSTAGQYSVSAYIVKTGGDKSVASGVFQVN